MPSKLQFYSEFAERTARQITGSYRSWTAFLATAARLYKYPYNEQLKLVLLLRTFLSQRGCRRQRDWAHGHHVAIE